MLASVTLALAGGVVIAAWDPDPDEPKPTVEECLDPPCFGGGGLPSASDLPIAASAASRARDLTPRKGRVIP